MNPPASAPAQDAMPTTRGLNFYLADPNLEVDRTEDRPSARGPGRQPDLRLAHPHRRIHRDGA